MVKYGEFQSFISRYDFAKLQYSASKTDIIGYMIYKITTLFITIFDIFHKS